MSEKSEAFKFRYLVTDNINKELLGVASLRHPLNSDLDLSQDSSTNETYDDEEVNVTFSQENRSPLMRDIPAVSKSKCSQKLETFASQPIVENAPFPTISKPAKSVTFDKNPSIECGRSMSIIDSVRTA